MDGEWKTHRVGDIAAAMGDAPFGSLIKNHDYTDSGAYIVFAPQSQWHGWASISHAVVVATFGTRWSFHH